MKNDYYRLQRVIKKDRMSDCASLTDLISGEVALTLSNFVQVLDCQSFLKIEEDGELDIQIFVSAKKPKPICGKAF